MIARVALPLPVDKIFSYALPEPMAPFVRPLSRIRVPFNNRSLVGVILSCEEGEEDLLKRALELVDCIPLIDDRCAQLCLWASRHYVTPVGLVFKYALSSTIDLEKHCIVVAHDASLASMDRMPLKKAYAQAGKEAVLDCLGHSRIALCDVFTGAPIGAKPKERPVCLHRATLYVGGIEDRKSYYLSVISKELKEGRNVLMLLPDREAGDFFHHAFLESFSGAMLRFDSAMTAKKRAETYFRARSEEGRLILGHRSSVFLPLAHSGLIIVERPEEDEYRNKEAFRFDAVRVAMMRAEMEGVPIILGSFAPPVEIMKKAREGSIDVQGDPIFESPTISSARSEKSKGREARMPEAFMKAVAEALDGDSGNVVIHTPRRSYASSLYCGACSHWLTCPACSGASLSYNRIEESLICNTCKTVIPYREECPQCGSPFIRFLDVGAEYVEARLHEAFPDRTVLRITGENGTRQKLRAFSKNARESAGGSIIVGTHVLSKLYGMQTSLLVLYGWEDFLRSGGFRVREKMYQVFMNLIDALKPPRLLLYTYGKEPFDPSLFLDRARFYADELQKRQAAEFPPYVRFYLVNILKRNKRAGEKIIKAIERLVEEVRLDHEMLGPIDLKGQYGWRVILKGDDESLHPLLSSLYRLPGVHIEADPLYL